MKCNIKCIAAIAAIAAALGAAPAAAQDAGFYLGGSVGQSKAGDTCSDMPAGVSCDDKTTTWKLIGGYQFNRYIAAELGYSPSLAKASASGFGVTADVKVSAWELVAIPSYPLGDFSLYGKLGFYAAKTEGRSNVGISADDSNTDFTYGFGAGYRINRNFSARAEWQRYSKVGGDNNGKADIDALNFGVLYHF